MRTSFAAMAVVLSGCGAVMMPVVDAGPLAEFDGGSTVDAGDVADAGLVVDSGVTLDAGVSLDAGVIDSGVVLPTDGGALTPCPTTGMGAIVAPAGCFTPRVVDTGLPASSTNTAHYALEPSGTPKQALVLYFASSVASPAMQIPDPQRNFYNAAASEGFHVISLVHENQQVLGISCRNAECYGATRKTVITGRFETGAIMGLRDIEEHEGAVRRLEALLTTLAAARPQAGWNQFLTSGATPAQRIDWSRIVAVGHSQGGGHAAYLGKMFSLRRVVQLSSTCDIDSNDMPVPWTAGPSGFATSPATHYFGFAAPSGDTICPGHLSVWRNLGMDMTRMLTTAATCGARQTHNVTIDCLDNEMAWRQLLR